MDAEAWLRQCGHRLELRFQPEAVRRLAARLGAIDDVQRPKPLFRAAIQVPSLEAFRLLLDEAG